jgi:hypothetical protein
MEKDSYSLGDLTAITGAKRRSIQLWADRGVIEAFASTANAGTGIHRAFSRREVIIACVIHPFAERQIAIGELLAISGLVRQSIRMTPEPYEAAIAGAGDTIFAYERHLKDGKWIKQYTIMPREQFARRGRSWPDMIMAIRLETYLGKLK